MNISSSVVTPPLSVQASQIPSLAPCVLSQAWLSPWQSSPWCGPVMHMTVSFVQGPPGAS